MNANAALDALSPLTVADCDVIQLICRKLAELGEFSENELGGWIWADGIKIHPQRTLDLIDALLAGGRVRHTMVERDGRHEAGLTR